jgi:hypothetical protein
VRDCQAIKVDFVFLVILILAQGKSAENQGRRFLKLLLFFYGCFLMASQCLSKSSAIAIFPLFLARHKG